MTDVDNFSPSLEGLIGGSFIIASISDSSIPVSATITSISTLFVVVVLFLLSFVSFFDISTFAGVDGFEFLFLLVSFFFVVDFFCVSFFLGSLGFFFLLLLFCFSVWLLGGLFFATFKC